MQKGIHPEYRQVLFHDMSVEAFFLVGSTIQTNRTYQWTDGKTYPYVTLDVSSESHPYYTGKQKVTQTEGRVAAFDKKFGNFGKSRK